MKKMSKIVSVVSLALGLSLGAGIGVCAVSVPKEGVLYTDPQMTNEVISEPAEYNLNANGKTYGSASMASNESELPDLIGVVGENGTNGYIMKSDFILEQPASPDEVPEYMEKKRKIEKQGGYKVPVYDVDGVTVIDEFTIGGNSSEIEYSIDKNGNKIEIE